MPRQLATRVPEDAAERMDVVLKERYGQEQLNASQYLRIAFYRQLELDEELLREEIESGVQ